MNYLCYWGYLNYLIVFQVRCKKGILEKVLAEKCAAISVEIEGLGEIYHYALPLAASASLSARRQGEVPERCVSTRIQGLSLDLSTVPTKVVVGDDDV